MKTLLSGLILSASMAGAVHAQSAEALCHHAGLTYSPGSMITMGQSLQRCGVTEAGAAVWSFVDGDGDAGASANCVSGGREFGQGSLLPAGATELICSKGIWYKAKE